VRCRRRASTAGHMRLSVPVVPSAVSQASANASVGQRSAFSTRAIWDALQGTFSASSRWERSLRWRQVRSSAPNRWRADASGVSWRVIGVLPSSRCRRGDGRVTLAAWLRRGGVVGWVWSRGERLAGVLSRVWCRPVVLGLVQGGVGGHEQGVEGAGGVRGGGGADPAGQPDPAGDGGRVVVGGGGGVRDLRDGGEGEGGDAGADAVRGLGGLVEVGVGEDDDELVAAETADQVIGACLAFQGVGDRG